jgi:SH3-like domain-containing protein
MQRIAFFVLCCFFSGAALADNPSGLPIPRFVSLKSDETNIRTGPGTRYPIQWVFKHAHMPVQVVDEFELWRKIRDKDGATGWVHHTMLAGKRFAMITGAEPRILRIDASEDSKPLLKAAPGVIGPLSECGEHWCRLQVSGRKAWIQKDYLWGVTPADVFD